jgi:histone H3/H4
MNTFQPEVNFAPYIKKVLRRIHPDIGLTTDATVQLNALINIVGGRIAEKASFLSSSEMASKVLKKKKGGGTCTTRGIQAGVRLVIPGYLADHVISEGTKAVTKYAALSGPGPAGQRRKPVRRESKAGLQFSVPRAEKLLRSKHCGRVGGGAGVYLAVVLEHIAAEFLDLSGSSARYHRRARITVRDLQLVTSNDVELSKLTQDWNWSGGGVIPNIHSVLLPLGPGAPRNPFQNYT